MNLENKVMREAWCYLLGLDKNNVEFNGYDFESDVGISVDI